MSLLSVTGKSTDPSARVPKAGNLPDPFVKEFTGTTLFNRSCRAK